MLGLPFKRRRSLTLLHGSVACLTALGLFAGCGDPMDASLPGATTTSPSGVPVEPVETTDGPSISTRSTREPPVAGPQVVAATAVPTDPDPDQFGAFFDAYRTSPKWNTSTPALGPFEMWRDRGAAYLVVGQIKASHVSVRPYEPAMEMPCSESAPTTTCWTPSSDIASLVVEVNASTVVMLAVGQDSKLQLPQGDIPLLFDVGVVQAGEDALPLVMPLVKSVPLGATVVALVGTLPSADGTEVHQAFGATTWAFVDVNGVLHKAHREDWPDESGVHPYTTLDELLSAARSK